MLISSVYYKFIRLVINGVYDLFCSGQIETMSKEIDMFEKFLKRLDPKDIQLKGK